MRRVVRVRRSGSILSIALVTAAATVFAAEPAEPPAMRSYENKEGGVRVRVPEAWFLKEIARDGILQIFLSREKVDKPGDLYTYGLSILRLRDYRRAFRFEATSPQDVALEYATHVAAQLAGGEGGSVVLLKAGDGDGRPSRFTVQGGKGEECVSGNLLILVRGHDWFHALWESPCSESGTPERVGEIDAMIDSLAVERSWGGPPAGE